MSAPAETADIAYPLACLRAGDVVVELRHDSVAARAAGLDALLRHFPETVAKLVWIGNPLRSPLTIERLFLQAAGPEADLRLERSPERLAAILRSVAEGAQHCLFILHQPETLDAEARELLAAIAPLLKGITPTIQFLVCGNHAFRSIVLPPIASSPAVPHNRPLLAITRLANETVPELRTTTGLPRLLLAVLVILAVLPTATVIHPPRQVPAVGASASPVADEPPAPDTARATSDPSPAPIPPVDLVALRREFDAFLAQQPPRLANLTPSQRDALFDEFVERQRRRDRP